MEDDGDDHEVAEEKELNCKTTDDDPFASELGGWVGFGEESSAWVNPSLAAFSQPLQGICLPVD